MKTFTKKTLSTHSKTLGTALILSSGLLSGSALAHNNLNSINISSDSCNMAFQHTVRIQPNTLEIQTQNDHVMRIEQDGTLYINDEAISLSSQEQQTLENYADNLRQQLPQVANIALEGVKIAGIAIDEVGNAFGLNSMDSMSELMEELSVKIHDQFYQDGTFVMSQQGFDSIDDTFGESFESKMEEAMQAAVMDSIGGLLVALGSELIGSGGDMDEFEKRMENMGKQIEQKVALQAKNLEQKAEAFCGSIEQLALQEDQLQEFLPELKAYDLFAVNH
ncbi:hypothetical protein CJF42_14895 [Pseudoalteromonas sp. NBT06-2]|uniref:YggN family protein n=1 Tax=Pseudoalteromonas sp. NBT06-2 TaxID=2025950 RepID=UPI000BA615DF|nr:YggN family protein [Pseudoalteromonas sp. NBT06-2]PAJ73627.1 hypothetical protein CJF42_14895 [Pseudoalteromonas sp. NBT06-2]